MASDQGDAVAIAVALADKLDTLVGFWAIDEKPTGSKDPYALRRAALGLIRIVLSSQLRIRLTGKAAIAAGVHFGGDSKEKIISLVERDGQVRSFHVPKVNGSTLKSCLHGHIAKDSHLMTDELRMYRKIGREFLSHQTVNHSKKEYARGKVTTNTVEGYFSILKRGLIGTYHHVGSQHLKRYVEEFDFRYNHRSSLGYSDTDRATALLGGIGGKRFTYY